MIAAFLPLPPNPMREMRERDTSTSNLDSSNDNVNEYARHIKPMDEARYESARWWRQLNRIMSFIGLMIIGTIVCCLLLSLELTEANGNADHACGCRCQATLVKLIRFSVALGLFVQIRPLPAYSAAKTA